MAKKKKVNAEEKDLEYYKTAALFWETYAKNIEEELAKQGKKTPFESDAGLPGKKAGDEGSETV